MSKPIPSHPGLAWPGLLSDASVMFTASMTWRGVAVLQAIEKGDDASVCLLNYRADMTTFWNLFFVAALRDGDGTTVNYVGVQCKVRLYHVSVHHNGL